MITIDKLIIERKGDEEFISEAQNYRVKTLVVQTSSTKL